ncbi:MAG: glycosyltransferase [Rubrivivax sp.]|nr:glycosyltransferase [Rubrivivax sp.]
MKLLAVAGEIDGFLAGIRLRRPLQALCDAEGWPLTLRSLHEVGRADLGAADLLVVQRSFSERAWRLQRAARQRGLPVVYDIDDLLTDPPPHLSNQAALLARQASLRRCLAEADVLAVSTARLGRELLSDLGATPAATAPLPQTVVVPNCSLPLADETWPAAAGPGPVSLLFAASEHMACDHLYPALRRLQAERGAGVQVVVVGPPAAAFAAAGVRVQCHGLMPRADFLALVRGLSRPLAVIPLEDSRFAACKSAIKWFDYAEIGVPVLCSAVSPYREVVADGVTGRLVANDDEAWFLALQQAVDDDGWRVRAALAARRVVRERHTLAQTVAAWREALTLAQARRAAHPLPAPSLGWRLRETVSAALEGGALRLRQLNRARLARRQARSR